MQVSLINSLSQPLKAAAGFVASQETALAVPRFIQDTTTNWVPKATFSRSKADLAENTFLEFSESALVYFAPALVGEKIARKAFTKGLSKEAKMLVSTPAKELLKSKNPLAKQVMPIKAAIALTALLIPLTEFCLNYFKNLFTLKVFKKGDFNNIANLEKNKEQTKEQEKVKKSAYKNITTAGVAFLSSMALGALMLKKGQGSKFLQNIGETVLAPGTKFFKNSPKKMDFFNKYFSIDFDREAGKKSGEYAKLVLSKGQLTSCVLIGGLGYFGASKDRGKQNLLETSFRYPLVGLYVITGSELFEKGFKKILQKTGKCKEILGKNLETPSFKELGGLAQKLSTQNGSSVEQEFKKLAKQKTLIYSVPFLFSIGFMGFFVAGVSNLFTKFRHKKEIEKKEQVENTTHLDVKEIPNIYKPFFS